MTASHPLAALVSLPSAMLLAHLVGCGRAPDVDQGARTIAASDLSRLTRTLAEDAFAGRGPDSRGETASLEFLAAEMARIGLNPMGDPDGASRGWYQQVPVARITADAGTASFRAATGNARRGPLANLRYGADFVTWTRREETTVDVTAPLVFVGYGIRAPEEGWDDFARDIRGSILLVLVNDPPLPDRFGGPAMTYYGRWTYKVEEAARRGAAGVLLIHDTGAAGYGWEVVRSSWTGPQFHLPPPADRPAPVAVEGWISADTAVALFAAGGLDLAEAIATAASPEFEPVSLEFAATLHLDNALERIASHNVVGGLPGRSRDNQETVLWTAHWDHLGEDPSIEGDGIYNGALDNASGLAALLEVAEAFASLEPRTRRSHLFVATTLEEKGLLGSAYYAQNPVVPLAQTVAAINIDGINVWGPTRDLTVIGLGNSDLDQWLARAVAPEGRTLSPDPEPEKGFYYRSDHFPLAKVGIPALYTDAGMQFIGKPPDFGLRARDRYTRLHYHRPSDEFDPSWDFTGAEQDIRALYRVGWALAESDAWPEWSEGSEFRAARATSLR